MNKIERLEINRAGLGNTGKQAPQSIYYSFTWFEYTLEQIEQIEHILRHETDWYVFQEEKCPTTNKLHIQGTLKFKKRKRLTELKKLLSNSVHWESTKSVKASLAYCSKENTRCGKQWIFGIEIPEPIIVEEPYGWQLKVMDILTMPPHKRHIHWFWEETGNVGKSTLSKYLVVKHNALCVQGKSQDIFYALKQNPNKRKIIIIDIPRTNLDYINYSAIESIKNGLIFSSKYESEQLVFNTPHIIVFANSLPDLTKLSNDRWDIHYIHKLMKEL